VSQPPLLESPAPVTDGLRELLEQARRGNLDVLPKLREALDSDPELWRKGGDLASYALSAWIKAIAGQNLVFRESLARKAKQLGADLAGPLPSPLESLLVERAVACWLETNYAMAAIARPRDDSIKMAEYDQKRLDRSHRRYLTAIGALATIQRLLPNRALATAPPSLGVETDAAPAEAVRPSISAPVEPAALVSDVGEETVEAVIPAPSSLVLFDPQQSDPGRSDGPTRRPKKPKSARSR
jgi:hypothetical protein